MILESSDFDPREENAYFGGELKVTKAVARGHNVLVSLLKSITFFINVIIITPLDVSTNRSLSNSFYFVAFPKQHYLVYYWYLSVKNNNVCLVQAITLIAVELLDLNEKQKSCID